MRPSSFASILTIAALLTTAIATPATADPSGTARPAATALRTSIDRAARDAVAQAPARPRATTPVRKAMMQGGGGGGGMMLMALIGTAAGLAGTYFIVKEMRKQNDQAQTGQ